MLRKISRSFWVCGLAAGLAVGAASAQTADELVAKNNQAQGGRKLREVRSVRMTGTLKVGGAGESRSLLLEFVPPRQKVRLDLTDKSGVNTTAYDGATGWSRKLADGKTDPERLSGDALRSIKATADFQGPLFDPGGKGHQVEYLGKAEVAGAPAYKLRLTTADGDETLVFLDAKTYLSVREESTRGGANDVTDKVTTFSDFKTIDGITYPAVIETTEKESISGGAIRMEGSVRIEIQNVELNVDIPAARFARPKSGG